MDRKHCRVGMKVTATREFRRMFRSEYTTGMIVGFSRKSPRLIMIRRDGLKSTERYHPMFWQPVQP